MWIRNTHIRKSITSYTQALKEFLFLILYLWYLHAMVCWLHCTKTNWYARWKLRRRDKLNIFLLTGAKGVFGTKLQQQGWRLCYVNIIPLHNKTWLAVPYALWMEFCRVVDIKTLVKCSKLSCICEKCRLSWNVSDHL